MKNKIFRIVMLLMFFAFFMQGCKAAGIAGIDEPITIDGIDFIVSEVVRTEEYTSGNQVSRPQSSDDILLIVQADLSTGYEEFKQKGWNISVVDENGRSDTPSMTTFMSGIISGENRNILELIFAVDEDSDSFTLIIPGNEIVLDSLISK